MQVQITMSLSVGGIVSDQVVGRTPVSSTLSVELLERNVVECQIDRLVIYRQRNDVLLLLLLLFFFFRV